MRTQREDVDRRTRSLERSLHELYEREQRLLDERTALSTQRREFERSRPADRDSGRPLKPVDSGFLQACEPALSSSPLSSSTQRAILATYSDQLQELDGLPASASATFNVDSLRRSADAIHAARRVTREMDEDSAMRRWVQEGERVPSLSFLLSSFIFHIYLLILLFYLLHVFSLLLFIILPTGLELPEWRASISHDAQRHEFFLIILSLFFYTLPISGLNY